MAEVCKALAHLCALKRTTEFSEVQAVAWYGGLRAFPPWIINRAVLNIATSSERFPEFGDVYQLCRREASRNGLLKELYSPHGSSEKNEMITQQEITTIGDALGLCVRPSSKGAKERTNESQ